MTAIATKFVKWDVPALESVSGSKVFTLRTKLNNGEKMNRLTIDGIEYNTYFP